MGTLSESETGVIGSKYGNQSPPTYSRASTSSMGSTELPCANRSGQATPPPQSDLRLECIAAGDFILCKPVTETQRADPSDDLKKPDNPKVSEKTNGSLITIFSIWNTLMGSSLLIMPWAIAQAGYVLGTALTVFLGCLSYYTCSLVLKTADQGPLPNDAEKAPRKTFTDFGDAIEHYLGRKLSFIGILISLLTFLGALVAYWVFMSRFLFNVGNVIHHFVTFSNQSESIHSLDIKQSQDPDHEFSFSPFWSAKWTVPLYLIAILFPISCMREPTVFTKFNAVGVASVFVLISYVIYRAATWGIHMNTEEDSSIQAFSVNFPAITGSLSMGFFIHNGIIPIASQHRYPERKHRDLGIGYLLVALTYLAVGIIYYLAFPTAKSDIPDNFLRLVNSEDIFGIVASVFLLFQMSTVFPLLLFMFRVQFMAKIVRLEKYRYWWILAINASVVTVCVLLAIFWPKVGAIIRIIGAISGFVYNFSFPCLVFLAVLRVQNKVTKMAILGHSAIIIFGILNLIGQFVIPL